jgi:hypothetical protein
VTRRLRLSGGESPLQRAQRLADIDLAGFSHVLCRGAIEPEVASARVSGFVAGYMAALEDEVQEPPRRRGGG